MYYTGNAVYQYLADHPPADKKMIWAAANMWMLVYGSTDNRPRVLCFVKQTKPEEQLTCDFDVQEQEYIRVFRHFAAQVELPMFYIRFSEQPQLFGQFWFWSSNSPDERGVINGEQLLLKFREAGVPVQNGRSAKDVNDQVSSAYHRWQREHMGASPCVSDLDLLEIKNGEIQVIYELKRSLVPLDKWKPFQADYANFILLSKLSERAGIKFYILYNVYHKGETRKEDISRIKVFSFNHAETPPVKWVKTADIEEVFNDSLR